jgi:hypothetical protein
VLARRAAEARNSPHRQKLRDVFISEGEFQLAEGDFDFLGHRATVAAPAAVNPSQ